MRHILDAGDDLPRRQRAERHRQVGRRTRPPKPQLMAERQPVLGGCGFVDIGVVHVQRQEDSAADVLRIGRPACRLDDEPQQVIVHVAVRTDRAGSMVEFARGEGTRLARGGAGVAVEIRQRRLACTGGQAAGLVQQVAHGDQGTCVRVRHPEPGEIALDRGVERELAPFHQLHHRQRRNRLGKRADKERRLGIGSAAFGVRTAKSADMNDLVARDDGKRHGRYVQAPHALIDIGIDLRLAGKGARCSHSRVTCTFRGSIRYVHLAPRPGRQLHLRQLSSIQYAKKVVHVSPPRVSLERGLTPAGGRAAS